MKFILFDDVVKQIYKEEENSGLLFGKIFDEYDVVQLLSINKMHNHVGFWVKNYPLENALIMINKLKLRSGVIGHALNPLLILFNDHKINIYDINDGKYISEENIHIINKLNVFNRIKNIVDYDLIKEKRVSVIGLGSGGSRVALELAKSGIGTLYLIDPDRLEVDNIIRHICGLDDIGRYKTRALKDKILLYNPFVNVECCEIDVHLNVNVLKDTISKSDLVIEATGSAQVSNLINKLCFDIKKPVIFASVWEKASGGYVMRYIPDVSPCFNCVHEYLFKLSPSLDVDRIDYSIVRDVSELKSEPGLSIDIGFITLLQSKIALHTLIKSKDAIEDIPHHFFIWLNQGHGDYSSLTLLKGSTKIRDDCYICNPEGWEKSLNK